MTKDKKDSSNCPDLSIIEEKGKELNLKDETIEKAKDFAIEYFKKTDKVPKYPKMLMPAFLYIAALCTCGEHHDYGEKRTQVQLEKVFNISSHTIHNWYIRIVNELHIEIVL